MTSTDLFFYTIFSFRNVATVAISYERSIFIAVTFFRCDVIAYKSILMTPSLMDGAMTVSYPILTVMGSAGSQNAAVAYYITYGGDGLLIRNATNSTTNGSGRIGRTRSNGKAECWRCNLRRWLVFAYGSISGS